MGQCGCKDFDPDYALPGPDGTYYTIQLDPGCRDCDEHRVGVVIEQLSGDAVSDWDVEHVRELELRGFDGADLKERTFVVLDPDHVASLLAPELAAVRHEATDEEFQEVVRDAVRETLRDAVFRTRADAEKDGHLA